MAQLYEVSLLTVEVPVYCGNDGCSWCGPIKSLIKRYSIVKQGFEMGFCPSCVEMDKAHSPIIVISMTRGFQGVRGIPAEPPVLVWRIGSGEKRFASE